MTQPQSPPPHAGTPQAGTPQSGTPQSNQPAAAVPPGAAGPSNAPPVPPQPAPTQWQAAAHGQSWQSAPPERTWDAPTAATPGAVPIAAGPAYPGQGPQQFGPAAPVGQGTQYAPAPQQFGPAPQQHGPAPQQYGPPPQQFGQPAYQPGPAGHPWLPQPQQFGPAPALPVEPREYHEFLRTPRLRWWRPVLALLMGAALFFAVSTLFTLPAMFYDISTGRTTMANYTSLDAFVMTPAFFLANNVALAACIPIAGLTQWACFGQRPRWMSSVVGSFRWRWFGECVLVILPLFAVSLLLDIVFSGGLGGLRITPDTWFMVAAILFTTPLQSAGEEYLLRGLGQRAVASWLPSMAGLVVSTIVTAVIFMLLHGAGDPWLNAFYLFFAVISSVLAWRTGGLEASVAMHAVNNVISMTFLPFSDFSDMFNRTEGTGSPAVLVQFAILAGSLALVLWRAKLRGIVRVGPPAVVGHRDGAFVPPVPGQPAQQRDGAFLPPVAGQQAQQPAAQQPPPHDPQRAAQPAPWRQDDGQQTH